MFRTALINKKILTSLSLSAIMAGSGLLSMGTALAATGSVYLSPANTSVQSGNNVTVSVRVNPGANIDSVQGSVSYEAAKLQFVSVSTASSAFTTELQNTQSSGVVNFARGDFGAGVSSDALIETITFKALASNGSSALTLINTNADSGGTYTNPGVAGATVSFTAPSCPAGQTGTPPNCHAPVTTTPTPTSGGSSGGSGSNSGGSKGSTGSSGTKTTTPSSGSSSTTSTSTPTTTAAPTATDDQSAATVTEQKIDYTQAVLHLASKDPTKVYIKYGVNGDLSQQTTADDFNTDHMVSLDPSLLVPGETYSYVIVSTNKAGVSSQSTPQTLTLKGMTVRVAVYDSKHQPLRNKSVTLHSKPYVAKTDANGFATFSNVIPGDHEVSYAAGKQTYQAGVKVTNNVQTKDGVQTAALQNAAVVYNFEQGGSQGPLLIIIGLLVLAVAVLIGYIMRQRFLPASVLNRFGMGARPVVSAGNASAAVLPTTMVAPLGEQPSVDLAPLVEPIISTPVSAVEIPAIAVPEAPPLNDASTIDTIERPAVVAPGNIVTPDDHETRDQGNGPS